MKAGEARVELFEVLPNGTGRTRQWLVDLETGRAIAESLGEPTLFGVMAREGLLDLTTHDN